MSRVYNFGPGPACLPLPVLEQARAEFLDWNNLGMSLLEVGHRTKPFMDLVSEIENDFRELLNIPSNYHVLFLPGGAQIQFSMIPMNLLGKNNSDPNKAVAEYLITGQWSLRAAKAAEKYCKPQIVASNEATDFTEVPPVSTWKRNKSSSYFHYTSNETVDGISVAIPDIKDVPLVADMCSDILSKPIDVSQFGLIYACTQKNIGPSGMTVVIVRDDLVGNAMASTPHIFNYKLQAENHSLLNTPPSFTWYMTGLVLKWLKKEGGLSVIEKRNKQKANKLYMAIDASEFYSSKVNPNDRSMMNVTFNLPTEELEKEFVAKASEAGLANLKGHKLIGGIRASLYNALPEEAVDSLIKFMGEFEERGKDLS